MGAFMHVGKTDPHAPVAQEMHIRLQNAKRRIPPRAPPGRPCHPSCPIIEILRECTATENLLDASITVDMTGIVRPAEPCAGDAGAPRPTLHPGECGACSGPLPPLARLGDARGEGLAWPRAAAISSNTARDRDMVGASRSESRRLDPAPLGSAAKGEPCGPGPCTAPREDAVGSAGE
jgi:hypothetical protein